jgi:catechol 2,3-dioxygenase-like lactoylglutathione lyase family enzyme
MKLAFGFDSKRISMQSLISCRINIMVSNMEQAIGFYIGTLGLQLLNRYGNHYAEIQTPDMLIALHPTDKPILAGNGLSIGFGVREFDANVQDLQAKGINLDVVQDGWIRLAHFKDPDNNLLFLAERKD